jgi:anti-sigma B factor antagonist
MKPDLQILITNQPNATIVKLVGEARMDTDADELLHLHDLHPRKVIIDATDLTFIASVGMRLLINLQRSLSSDGSKLLIAGLRPALQRAFHEAKLTSLFDLRPDVPSAMS